MLNQERIHNAVKEALAYAGDVLQQVRRAHDRGLIAKNKVLSRAVQIAQETEASLNDTIRRICSEEDIPWDQAEWDSLKKAILSACGLQLVPYEYHPRDPGFDLLTESMYVIKDRLIYLDELYLHPDPAGKTFRMKLKLKNGDGFVWVDYKFEVIGVSAGTGDWEGYRKFDGHGRFPGYSGEATINITERCGALRSVLFQKTYPQHDDPVWQRRKAETAVGYRYELME